MPTKYDNLLLIYIFKTSLSKIKKNKKGNNETRPKKKATWHAQSVCDEASTLL